MAGTAIIRTYQEGSLGAPDIYHNILIENNLMIDPTAFGCIKFKGLGTNIVVRNNLVWCWYRPSKYCIDQPPVPPNPFWDQAGGETVLSGGPMGRHQMNDDVWMGCKPGPGDPPCNPMRTGRGHGGDRYKPTVQLEKDGLGPGIEAPSGLSLFNNVFMGSVGSDSTNSGTNDDIIEGNNIFWTFGSTKALSAPDSMSPGSSYIIHGDFYESKCANMETFFESPNGVGSEWFFEEQPDLFCSKWGDDPVEALQNWRVSNKPIVTPNHTIVGATFGDPNNQPLDSLGGVGPDGFLLPVVPRNTTYPTVGPYQYVPALGRY